MPNDASLVEIAAAVCDGTVVDWAAAESSAGSDADRARIRGLRLLAEVTQLHATWHGPAASASQLHDSILHPGRRSSEPADEAETRDMVRWGPLEIVEKVGRGSFGDVYRAWDPRLDRDVALKLLRRRDVADDALGSSVIEEGRLQARVRHPGVITIHGADRIDGRVGLWMEFIQGSTLEQELEAHGPVDATEAAQIGLALCRALGAVHEEGLLHRDVKAQNVMRDEKGRLVLGDFGTGRGLVDGDGGVADTAHDVAGTPLYLAPEIFRREPATVQSDLYSLGVLLYHLVTGSFPVRGRSVRQLRDSHDLGSSCPLAEARPGLPEPFVQVVDRALDPEAGRRYASAAEMETALAACVSPPRDRSRVWRAAAGVAAGLVIAIAAIAVATWSGLLQSTQRAAATTGAPLAFQERDWVLVADFENATGEELFDGAIDAALLEREVRNSTFVNVVPRERVHDALRLMQKPVETRLDPGVAREVALRDGEISAVVAGRVERRGAGYLLTASVLNLSGATVASRTEEAVDQDEVLSAMRRLSDWLRAELGEALTSVEAGNQRLEKVTTPSLGALQVYSQGYALYRQLQDVGLGGRPESFVGPADLFRQAIAVDPEFASAYNMLGWSVRFDDPDEALRLFERAMELSPNTTERDRLFIEGTYYNYTGQPEQAAAKYKTLLALHPDHFYAANNLVGIYSPRFGDLDRPDEFLRWQVYIADRRPNNFLSQLPTALALRRFAGQSDRWKRYAMRAYVLKPLTLDEWPGPDWLHRFVWLNFFPAYEHWSRGEIDEASREIDRLTRTIATQSPEVRELYVSQVGSYYLAFGQLQKATALFEGLSDANVRASRLAWVADCLDDAAAIQEQLSKLSLGNTHRPLRVVRAGLALERFGFPGGPIADANMELALGELALRQGDLVEAVERFERGLEGLGESYHLLEFFLASESLASAWQRLGNEPRALGVLEEAAHRTVRDRNDVLAGAFGRFRVRARLASEYRTLGRVDEAEALEDDVLRMLEYADADHPIVRQINASRASRSAKPEASVSAH